MTIAANTITAMNIPIINPEVLTSDSISEGLLGPVLERDSEVVEDA
jgi:hypothetical protein